ncbi:hypothetical protein B7494_g7033 [Chlorociboria aeruginascens]|nr:hypothetical protein B7494_g7033 [Chlorociboria aeruginascens]
MTELTHSTSKAAEETQAALPLTADLLLDMERKQRKRFSSRGDRICIENEEVDGRVFGDVGVCVTERTQGGEGEGIEEQGLRGIERGVVLGLSAGSGAGSEEGDLGRGISLHLLCSILLTHGKIYLPLSSKSSDPYPHHPPPPRAIVIDTSGSFPISLLASILKARLIQQIRDDDLGASHSNGKKWSEEEVEKEVSRLLEMVAISRVFDIEGLWEVLGEVGAQKSNSEEMDTTGKDYKGQESNQAKEAAELEIGDSEEEEDIDVSNPKTDEGPHESITTAHPEDGEDDIGTEIIIIDNLTTLISSLFSQKEKSAGKMISLLSSIPPHSINIYLTNAKNSTYPPNKPLPNTPHPNPHPQPTNHPPQHRHIIHLSRLIHSTPHARTHALPLHESPTLIRTHLRPVRRSPRHGESRACYKGRCRDIVLWYYCR